MSMKIKVRVSSVDGFRKSKTFVTLAGARKFASSYVGRHPDLGSHYAVSDTGTTKVTVEGVTVEQLFADDPAPAATACECEYIVDVNEARTMDQPWRPQPLTFDPLTGKSLPICDYCVSPKGVAERRKAQKRFEREHSRKHETDNEDILF